MMRTAGIVLAGIALCACGVSSAEYDAKAKEVEASKQQVTQLQQQLATDEQQITQLKSSLSVAQSQAMTDEQKALLQEAQDRGKLLADLEVKFKRMIDAGHLKVTTRHGRVVLQLRNDVLFDTGEAEVKPAGKQAIGEVAATLRAVSGKRFQVAGHTDTQPITTDKKKEFPTNWELSTARAIAVVKLLTSEGVDPAALSAAGYGPYDPVATNATPDGMAKNRRIEITLVPNVAGLVSAAKEAASAAAASVTAPAPAPPPAASPAPVASQAPPPAH